MDIETIWHGLQFNFFAMLQGLGLPVINKKMDINTASAMW
jgi:hypothetical protein